MATHMGDTGELDGNAPRPVHADSVSGGAFDRLEGGQGAMSASDKKRAATGAGAHRAAPKHHAVTSHAQDEEGQLPIDRRTLIVVVIGALVAIAIIVALFVSVLNASPAKPTQDSEAEQIAVQTDQSIVSRGATYELAQVDGKYQLKEKRDGGKSVSLGDLPGTPAGLVLYDGAVLIPENLGDGKWDVMSYTIGSGWSQIMDREGKAVGGEGTVDEVKLEGSSLALTVNGSRVDVPLTW